MLVLKGNPITKKNSQEIKYGRGKMYVSQSEAYLNYETDCLWQLKTQRAAISALPPPPYNIKCLYYVSVLRKVDTLNLSAATDDILVKAGVIPDDNCRVVISHDGSRVLYDHDNPRVEIYITHSDEEPLPFPSTRKSVKTA